MASSEGIDDKKVAEDIGENSWSESVESSQSEDRFNRLKCGDAVSKWYSEQKRYIYGISDIPLPAIPLTRHFTQMVWKSTKQLGCAKSYNNNYVYLVCHYSPKGNAFTQYKDNVMPKTGKLIWK